MVFLNEAEIKTGGLQSRGGPDFTEPPSIIREPARFADDEAAEFWKHILRPESPHQSTS
jgi:hypothetical protein